MKIASFKNFIKFLKCLGEKIKFLNSFYKKKLIKKMKKIKKFKKAKNFNVLSIILITKYKKCKNN
jgi:hypothetical protein